MSYEGYTQFFCQCGHQTQRDTYAETPTKCDWCGAMIVARHGVDTTNDNGDPLTPEIIGKDSFPCKCCKGTGATIVPRYKINQQGA